MKRKWIAIMLTLTFALSMTACKNQKNSNLEEFDIVLDWYPNAVHSFLYEAIEKGYYEEEGLKVNILFPANPNDAISMSAAGKADAGIFYLQDTVMARANENIPIKAIGTVVQKPLSIVASLKEKNIKSPADLVGKKLGYGGAVLGEAIIKTMLENQGKDKDSVQTVDVGFDLMSSMTTNQVDATIGCLVNHEIPQFEKDGIEVQYFFPTDYGVPEYYELVFVAGDKTIADNPEKLKKFLRASQKGFDDMKKNPQEALDILLKNQNEENFPLTKEVEQKSMDYLIPVMEKENASFLSQDLNVWQKNIDWLYEKGIIMNKIQASDIVSKIIP